MEDREFATLYTKVKIAPDAYILIPQEVIEGYSMGETFYSDEILSSPSIDNLEDENPVVDHIVSMDDLLHKYDYEDIEESFLLEYYSSEEKENLIVIEIKDGKINKKTMNISLLKKENLVHSLQMAENGPCIFLNEPLVNRLLNCQTVSAMRLELTRIKDQLRKFQSQNEVYGTTRILIKNGKILEMEDNGQVSVVNTPSVAKKEMPKEDNPTQGDFSKKGLLSYLKERVYGHDEELEVIATVLSRNLRPTATRQDIESIMIAGPTGTGKTVTFEAVSEYFNVPFRTINTPALVPEGIVGKSIDDYISSILEETRGDMAKAQKSIILFDEFDKVSTSGLDVKKSVIDELYKFMEGSVITIKKGTNYLNAKLSEFDTGLTTRIYTGVFEHAYGREKGIGFGASPSTQLSFNLETLYKNSSFNKELLDRIQYKLLYDELSTEDKKRALLSKIGILYKKRDMLKRHYGVELIALDEFIDAFLEQLKQKGQSMRDVNNLISSIIIKAESVIADEEGKYQRLILTRDTAENPHKFTLQ